MDIAHKIENVKVDRRGRCIDDVVVVNCGVIEEWFGVLNFTCKFEVYNTHHIIILNWMDCNTFCLCSWTIWFDQPSIWTDILDKNDKFYKNYTRI